MSDDTTTVMTDIKPGEMQRVMFPEFGDTGLGLNIAVGRYDEEFGGGLFISVNTEDMDTDHIDGEPQISMLLNDAVVNEPDKRVVLLSEEAFSVVCGLVQPSDIEADIETGVNHAGIFTGAWEELRSTFPERRFRQYFEGRDPETGTYYDPDAGM